MSDDVVTPWMVTKESADYSRRSPRILRRAVKNGELRAARIGGRGELMFRKEWLDEWIESLARPVLVSRRMMR